MDGSKGDSRVGVTVVCDGRIHKYFLNPNCSVLAAEFLTISKALNIFNPNHNLFIHTDSLSSRIIHQYTPGNQKGNCYNNRKLNGSLSEKLSGLRNPGRHHI